MKRIFNLFIGMFFLILLTNITSALEEGYCIEAVINDISPSSIGVGEEFTVGILIDNCGNDLPEEVSFELKDVSPFIFVRESLFTDVGQMGYSNSERFILYHMKVLDNANPGTYFFDYELSYGKDNFTIKKEDTFSITVTGDDAEMNIASVKTDPILPIEGDIVELTLRIENYGGGIANSVKVHTNHAFQGTKESFIGTLDPDEDGPAVFTFIADEFGEFEIPVKVSYKDDFGEHEVDSKINIMVLKKDINWAGIMFSIILIIGFGFFVLHYFRTKKNKDRIIQSLLRGEKEEENKSSKKKK